METIIYRGLEIRIFNDNDEDAGNPRTEFDNAGAMMCLHSRYDLGDEDARQTLTEYCQSRGSDVDEYSPPLMLEAAARKLGVLYLPVYMYDHSGLSISTAPFSCPWDSGQLGIIYITPEKISEEWPNDHDPEDVLACLKDEVEQYNDYISGDCYGFEIREVAGSDDLPIDSCYGYYGADHRKSGLLGMAECFIDAKLRTDNQSAEG